MKLINKKSYSGGVSNSAQRIEPKTIAAVVLVAAMVILWGRVLLRSKVGPAAANAGTPDSQVESDTTKSAVQICAVTLPVVAGRHDRIATDVFSADSQWKAFDWNQARPTGQTSRNGGDDNRQRYLVSDLTKAVVLDAIIQNSKGQPDKASLNGVVVSEGSIITVILGKEKYNLEVKSIESKQVELAWQEYKIVTKMPDYELGQ
jgi:hypothetical protein